MTDRIRKNCHSDFDRAARLGPALLVAALLTLSLVSGARLSAQAIDDKASSALQSMAWTSKAFRVAAENIRPSLVTIESFGGVSAIQGRIGGIRKQGEGNTTGILISGQGHIITSTFNFVQSPPVITVITHDGERRVAKLLGRDETRKICLLKIEPFAGIKLPELAEPGSIAVGRWAISVGVGYGDVNPAISTGIISALNRVGAGAIQTDANLSPANYGGPLLDIHGRLIGVCVPMNPQSQAVGAGVEWYDSGIGFAIPLIGAERILERLKSGENIYPAFLGVRTEPNPSGKGVRVAEIVADSPASNAGLNPADVILSINDIAVNNLMELQLVLNRFEAGTKIDLRFRSQETNEPKTVEVVLDRTPPPPDQTPQLEPPGIR